MTVKFTRVKVSDIIQLRDALLAEGTRSKAIVLANNLIKYADNNTAGHPYFTYEELFNLHEATSVLLDHDLQTKDRRFIDRLPLTKRVYNTINSIKS